MQDHTEADKDSLDLLEHKETVREGSFRRYGRMLDFIREHGRTSETLHVLYVTDDRGGRIYRIIFRGAGR